jgi:hypothetical protein
MTANGPIMLRMRRPILHLALAEVLGAPADVVQLGRRSAWRYDHIHEKRAAFTLIVITMVNSDSKADRVWVFFDEEDRLIHARGTFEADDAEYKLPFQD